LYEDDKKHVGANFVRPWVLLGALRANTVRPYGAFLGFVVGAASCRRIVILLNLRAGEPRPYVAFLGLVVGAASCRPYCDFA
jgi:hypothetical protein